MYAEGQGDPVAGPADTINLDPRDLSDPDYDAFVLFCFVLF